MKILFLILVLLFTNNIFAEELRYYDIEIIVIQDFTAQARNSELWPLQVNIVQPKKTVQLGKPVYSSWLPKGVDLKSSYKVLSRKNYQLSPLVKLISKSKTQRVIFHTAWRQPGLDKNKSLPIYFKREIPAAPVIADEYNISLNTDKASFQSDSSTAQQTFILEGLIRVTLARYLHLEAELVYKSKLPTLLDAENPFAAIDNENLRHKLKKQGVIHLKQKRRRIRSNELHYIDHPVLSILVHITPYEK